MNYLFVYGTLRKPANHMMYGVISQGCRCLGPATFNGKLYDLGDYPAAIACEGQGQVKGELYELIQRDWVLMQLDAYGGCSPALPLPHQYYRSQQLVFNDALGQIEAWVYLYSGNTPLLKQILSGDYLCQ